ncbi:MAG: antitoxin [Pseudonocardia sp.]|nr:antitoxin [Pseudonocardia sp.]
MRTTIDLPDDLHRIATSIARDTGQTLSATVTELVRRGLGTGESPIRRYTSPRSGLPVVHLGRGPVTVEDVRALDDEE